MANVKQYAARPIKLPTQTRTKAVHPDELQPEYEFVLSTESRKQVDADARKTIRSRVMRNYLEEKRGKKQNVSLVNSDSTLKAGTSLKGRFRLKSREQQKEEKRNPRARRKRKCPTASEDMPTTNAIAPNGTPNDAPDSPSERTHGPMASEGAGNGVVVTISRYQDARLDPFNVLPVPGGPRVDRLIHYCRPFLWRYWHSHKLTIHR